MQTKSLNKYPLLPDVMYAGKMSCLFFFTFFYFVLLYCPLT